MLYVASSCCWSATGNHQLGLSASDGQSLADLLGDWQQPAPQTSDLSNKQQQEARLAAWKARSDTATQKTSAQPAQSDVIVLD